jgi:hypothetical protein
MIPQNPTEFCGHSFLFIGKKQVAASVYELKRGENTSSKKTETQQR